MALPDTLAINAWTGSESPQSARGKQAVAWGLAAQTAKVPHKLLFADDPPSLADWAHERVGWGVVLAENDALSEADRARAVDLEPIRALVEARGNAPVFRYRPEIGARWLRRYYTDRPAQDIELSGAGGRGVAPGRLPRYLLLCGDPTALPWGLQYVLNQSSFVGRLPLHGEALENYVAALSNGWAGSALQPSRRVVWAPDHGTQDITWLMRRAIAQPVLTKLRSDPDFDAATTDLLGATATAGGLVDSLSEHRPALIVTTSHGMTGPLDDPPRMAEQLGLLVDQQLAPLEPARLLGSWEPDGAVWYAHACCSAGSDQRSSYGGVVEPGTSVANVLAGVAALGSRVAPLPVALLGSKKPLRAFLGHVEPTFDWTLRSETGQLLTATLVEALYDRMHRREPEPVGLAFDGFYDHVGVLLAQWSSLLDDVNGAVPGAEESALRVNLTAKDRQGLVILGDPTVALPALLP